MEASNIVATRTPIGRSLLPEGTPWRLDSPAGLLWLAAFVVPLHHVQNLCAIPVLAGFFKYCTALDPCFMKPFPTAVRRHRSADDRCWYLASVRVQALNGEAA